MKKNTKKKKVITVDFTNIYCLEDIDNAVFDAKFRDKLTEDEMREIIETVLDGMFGAKDMLVKCGYKKYAPLKLTCSVVAPNDAELVFKNGKVKVKKPSLIKRMWNKLFKKNK